MTAIVTSGQMHAYQISVDYPRFRKNRWKYVSALPPRDQAKVFLDPESAISGSMIHVSRKLSELGYTNGGDFTGYIWTGKPLEEHAIYEIECIAMQNGVPANIREVPLQDEAA